MKLFEVTNGYIGESYVRLYVIAKNKEMALDIATDVYKNQACSDTHRYPDNYWNNLVIVEICSDTSKPWNSDITE